MGTVNSWFLDGACSGLHHCHVHVEWTLFGDTGTNARVVWWNNFASLDFVSLGSMFESSRAHRVRCQVSK